MMKQAGGTNRKDRERVGRYKNKNKTLGHEENLRRAENKKREERSAKEKIY